MLPLFRWHHNILFESISYSAHFSFFFKIIGDEVADLTFRKSKGQTFLLTFYDVSKGDISIWNNEMIAVTHQKFQIIWDDLTNMTFSKSQISFFMLHIFKRHSPFLLTIIPFIFRFNFTVFFLNFSITEVLIMNKIIKMHIQLKFQSEVIKYIHHIRAFIWIN